MRRMLNRLYLISGWIAALFIVAICTVVTAQVVLNLIDKIARLITGNAIGLTIPSYSDFTGFFLAAASFLALAYTLREGGHIRVTLLTTHLSTRWRRVVELWCVGLATAMALYFAWYTLLLTHESFIYEDLSPGMIAVPIWIPQSGMLIGLTVLSIALVDEFVCQMLGHESSYEGKGENLLEETEISREDWDAPTQKGDA